MYELWRQPYTGRTQFPLRGGRFASYLVSFPYKFGFAYRKRDFRKAVTKARKEFTRFLGVV